MDYIKICPDCSTENNMNAILCENCGQMILDVDPVISGAGAAVGIVVRPKVVRLVNLVAQLSDTPQESGEVLDLPPGAGSYVLGRPDPDGLVTPDIDLRPLATHNAKRQGGWGFSRQQAVLTVTDDGSVSIAPTPNGQPITVWAYNNHRFRSAIPKGQTLRVETGAVLEFGNPYPDADPATKGYPPGLLIRIDILDGDV